MFHPSYRAILILQVSQGVLAVGSIAVGQVSLGIMTLLQYVLISLAATNQMGSLVLLSSGIYLSAVVNHVFLEIWEHVGNLLGVAGEKGKLVSVLLMF